MSQTGDSRPATTSSWVERVRAQEHAVPPTVKTNKTQTDDGVNAAHPAAKVDKTPEAEGITSVSAVPPRVRVETLLPPPVNEPPPPSLVNRGMLTTFGHYHGYPPLPLKPGVSVAEGAVAWRTFTRFSDDAMLTLAADAARTIWSDDPMVRDLYYTPLTAEHEESPMGLIEGLERLRAMQRETEPLNERTAAAYVPNSEYDDEHDDPLAGCCTDSWPCPDHFDLVFESYRDRQTDRHLEHGF